MVPSTLVAPPRRVVVVLGMHRSGTSAVAGCLQRMGVDFGPRLMPPNPDNPRGYFEHNDVVNLHDRLLLALDRSWDDPTPLPSSWWEDAERLDPYREQILRVLRRDFPAASLWGLKDPRLCRLLPWWETLWLALGCRPLFLLVRRAPAEVAASLARRDGMSPARAALLTLRHTLEAERGTRGDDRLLLDFDALRRDEAAALTPVRRALGLPAADSPGGSPAVDPALGRRSVPADALPPSPWPEEADAALRLGLAGDEPAMQAALDRLANRLYEAEPFLFPTPAGQLADARAQLVASRQQARWYEAEWQKARTRVETLQGRLERQKAASQGGAKPKISELNEYSNLRKQDLSEMINPPPSTPPKRRKFWWF